MRSSKLRGLAFGSAFATACTTPGTLGIELGSNPEEGGAYSDAPNVPEAIGDDESASDAAPGDASGPIVVPSYCGSYPRPTPQGGWESKAVYYGSDRKLSYVVDAEGNRIPDFSYAGFENGAVPPSVPQAVYVDGNKGLDDGSDATPRIQAAIDSVGQRPLQNGYRGAVVLGPGIFNLMGTISINRSGVVLRGAGHGGDFATNTVLMARGNNTAARVVLGSGVDNGWTDESYGTRTNITTSVVPVGSRVFQVADAYRLSIGDNVVIVHPLTAAWLAAMNGGETGSDPAWTVDLGPITYNRRIVEKRGNELTIDAPVFHHLNASLSQSYLYRTRRTNIVNHVGIENLWVDTEYTQDAIESHSSTSIEILGAEDAWLRDVTTIRFAYAGVRVQNGVRITVSNVDANDPFANRDVGRMHNFALDARAQLVLVTGCHAQNGRHHFVASAPMSTSGNVFLRSSSDAPMDFEESGAVRPFSQGLLFDNMSVTGNGSIELGCTSEPGLSNGHGWATVHSVLWNFRSDRSRGFVEKPPLGQNYAIGRGSLQGKLGDCANTMSGFIEQNVGALRQESLYEAQLCDRVQP
jgi:hypothetical protein